VIPYNCPVAGLKSIPTIVSPAAVPVIAETDDTPVVGLNLNNSFPAVIA
jgi:hypothetical protein